MNRALRKFVGSLNGGNKYVFFIILALVCVLAICIGIYAQFFYKYSDTDAFMIGIRVGNKKTAEEIDTLKIEFNRLFSNNIITNGENVRIDKLQSSRELVYTGYDFVNEDENLYSINAQIPILNINSEKAIEINNEIKETYYNQANNIMRSKSGNTSYIVTYEAFLNEDIISIVIKSSLKENNRPEKVTIKTYNYSMAEKKLRTLEELIELKQISKMEVQNIITQEIQKAYNNAKMLSEVYGTLYERDIKGDMYKIENTENYFLTQDGYVYLVYAYGNNEDTNEMDIVIF